MNLTAHYPFFFSNNKKLLLLNSTILLLILFSIGTYANPETKVFLNHSFASEKEHYTLSDWANISGKITDSEGNPLEGATITVSSTTVVTKSDREGNFIISADPDAILEITFVGFETSVINIGNKTFIQVQLKPLFAAVEEVVIVGYGTQKKASLTGAVSVVKMTDIKEQALATGNVVKAMDNRVPGITTSFNGNPNGGAAMLIRGRGSLNSSTAPLIIIDGVPTNRGLNELPVNEIESIQVLKDASAATIYGSRAANGVYIITTKSAKKGAKVEVNSSITVGVLPHNAIPLLNTEQYGKAQWRAARNDNVDPNYGVYSFEDHQDGNGNWVLDNIILPEYLDAAQTMKPGNTDWQREISRNAVSYNNNVTISNAGETGGALLAFDHLKSAGTTKYNDWTRLSVRLNSNYRLFNGRVKVGENFSVTKMKYTGGSWLPNTVNIQSIVPVRTVDGIGWGGPVMGMSDRNNPLLDIMRNRQNFSTDIRLMGSGYVDVEIIKNLRFRSTFGLDYAGYWNNQSVLQYQAGFMSETISRLQTNTSYGGSWTWNNVLDYNFSLKDNNFQAMIGQEATKARGANMWGARDGFASEDVDYMYLDVGDGNVRNGGLAWGNAQNSYFGRLNYDYKSRYLLTAIMRRDGSSRFGVSNRYAIFPSLSGGWVLSEESFLKDVSWISNVKIRYGWGKTGNQAIDNYASYAQYRALYGDNAWPVNNSTAYDIYGADQGSLASGYIRLQLGNPDLKWEATEQHNFGLDFSVLQNKLTGSLDYYIKNTTDILVKPPTLTVTGYGAGRWINGATMKNWGWEAILSYNDQVGNVNFSVTGNLFRNTNKFVYIVPEAVGAYPGNGRDQVILGRPLNSLYGYIIEGIFQNQAQVDGAATQPGKGVGRLQYRDVSGPDGKPDGKIDADDRTWIGVNEPKLAWGLNLQARWNNFDASVFFNSEIGRRIPSPTKGYTDFFGFFGGQNYGTRVLDSWSPDNTSSTIPAITKADLNSENRFSTYFVENTSYMKLQSVSVGYSLKPGSSRTFIKGGRFFLQGENLYVFKLKGNTFTGFDPKSWDVNFPLPTSVTIGVNINL
ncbi:TonB-dependent receptor [Agriterribacter sp.]|uniref:SusC/RagA family TonB-linked outer membrane protein n=1 Tax=Agriterribacter sp. TaxID=2821509 RepID=UPI002CB78567|nr:TonB-dependent receptor [Agriterribacter sp.]HRO45870.1 TonB-dependent receptor [Agriterribacter sp.]HRQ18945.1 TonB-dependent receptor [Agriterribacter sp.]